MELVKVFVVDDSAVVRSILTEKLNATGKLQVAGSAIDPFVAREKIVRLQVDVLLLDIEMPRMDGLTFLKYLMKYRPIPTIILSSLADGVNQASMEALDLGAVAVVCKPGGPYSVTDLIDNLTETILQAAHVDVSRFRQVLAPRPQANRARKMLSSIQTTHQLFAVGASTGGTVAMETLFSEFTADFPPTVAVIHMPENFTRSFANRLNDICDVRVKEAENGERAQSGFVYIAPGNRHLVVEASGVNRILRIMDGPRLHGQRPAVDVLFRSVANQVGKNSLGVLLTGMGRDGAEGLLRMKEAGAFTITQDEATCVVYGMPKEAVSMGSSCQQLPINRIAAEMKAHVWSG